MKYFFYTVLKLTETNNKRDLEIVEYDFEGMIDEDQSGHYGSPILPEDPKKMIEEKIYKYPPGDYVLYGWIAAKSIEVVEEILK